MASTIGWADRVDAIVVPAGTSRWSSSEANEVKTVVNAHATDIDTALSGFLSNGKQNVDVATGTGAKDVNIDRSSGGIVLVTLEDGGDPLPVGDEDYNLKIPTNINPGDTLLVLIYNENDTVTINLAYDSGWANVTGTNLTSTTIAPLDTLILDMVVISSTELRERH